MDISSLPASSSNSLVRSPTCNEQPPAILLSGQNFEIIGSPSGLPEAGPSQVGSQGLHHPSFPQPPPEVTALLAAEFSGDVLSPVIARNSPLVPWELPSEIGHFWSGLFKISDIKVTRTCHGQAFDLTFVVGRNEFNTKPSEYTYSQACLAFSSGMGAWRRGPTPG